MMRTVLALLVLSLLAPAAHACPEIVVPLDPKDPAFKSSAWGSALRQYKGRRHKRALKTLRKVGAKLQKDVAALFHPNKDGKTAPNKTIQRWLQKHVHTRHPGVLIRSDRFTYPAFVWWAWADTACRAGAFVEAKVALGHVRRLRPGADLLHHEALVLLRTQKPKEARALLSKAPPDSFLTPYLEGLLARADGLEDVARAKLLEAKRASDLDDQRQAVDKALTGP